MAAWVWPNNERCINYEVSLAVNAVFALTRYFGRVISHSFDPVRIEIPGNQL